MVKISNDLGLKEANEYALELKKAERAREVRDNRVSSSRPGSRIGSSRGSANNNNSRTGSAVSKTMITHEIFDSTMKFIYLFKWETLFRMTKICM